MSSPGYDTGLTRAQRTLLRAAIATRLAPLLVANGGYLRSIKSLPRPLKNGSEDELGWLGNLVQGQVPCIGIALGRKDFEPTGMDIPPIHFRGKLEVALYICSNNLRGYVDGRLETDVVAGASASADPGIDTMLEHVEELLLGESYDLGNGRPTSELTFEHEDEVFTGGDVTVWEQRASIWLEREINPDRSITQLVTEIQGLHSLEPTTDPENPLVETRTELESP